MKRLIAEWEPQRAVMLTWPRTNGDFAATHAAVEACFETIARAVARYEDLIISTDTAAQGDRLQGRLADDPNLGRMRFHVAPNNDVWARDHGPIGIATSDGPMLLKFGFDGWGGKHPAERDNALTPALAAQGAFGELPLQTVDMVLEGGAIDTDGAGTLLATASSALDRTRNPELDQAAIEALLSRHCGIRRFLWLHHGQLQGDDTDGHIDTLARFTNGHTIAYQQSGGAKDPNHAALRALETELKALRDEDGTPYKLVPLPWPGLHLSADGQPLPAGYANFLIINGAVLLPTYGVAADAEAIAVLQELFPRRQIVPVDCQALIRQYGSLHCVTMNIPA